MLEVGVRGRGLGKTMVGGGGDVTVLVTTVALTDYRSCGGMPCLRDCRSLASGDCGRVIVGRIGRRSALCSTHVRPGSLLGVAVGAASPRTTTPFGLAVRACGGVTRSGTDAASRPTLRRCLMSGTNRVSFPIVNELRMNNLAGGTTRGLVHRRLHPCLGRVPVIAMHVSGCGVSILNRIGDPKAFAVGGRGIGVFRTLTVTNSVAVCNVQGGIGLVHRSYGNRQGIVDLGLGRRGVLRSPCCCVRRGSVLCVTPGGAGTGDTDIDGDAAV